MSAGPPIGLVHSERMMVEAPHTVPGVPYQWPGFIDMPPVLATAVLVGFIENTCIQALRPYLAPGRHSVGTHIDIVHTAPTPAGSQLTARIELVEIHRRRLRFRVEAFDDHGPVGEGRHERAVIDLDRFAGQVGDRVSSGGDG